MINKITIAKNLITKPHIKHLLIALLCSIAVFAASYFNIAYRLNNTVSDGLYQHTKTLDGKIIVLGIDARALEEIGKFGSWDRTVIADVIDTLNSNPDALPAAIGVDVMFYGETNAESDDRLAKAAAQYQNVIVASSINFKNGIVESDDGSFTVDPMTVDSYEQPYDALLNSSRQALANTLPDGDGIVRSQMLYFTMPDGTVVNSMAYEIYQMYAQFAGLPLTVTPPMNSKNQWYVPFSADPGGYSDNFSVVDVLSGDLPPEFFADSIVLIGPYATGMMDSYLTAIDHTIPMHGVEIHANVVQALLDNNFKTNIPGNSQSIIFALITFLSYFAFRTLKPKWSTPLMFLLIGGFIGTSYFLGKSGHMLKLIYLPIALVLMYFTWLAVGYVTALFEKKRVTDTFKKYVAPQVVDELIKSASALNLGGSRRDIACMFVDIRGFTPMSEALTPEQVVELLNQYLDLTCKSIFAHNGTLDKFIGDATMAIFNAPLDLDDYVYRSVLTAWDIVKGGDALGKVLLEKYGRTVSFGIGLNVGPAVVGNIGNAVRMDYTAIGDTVNTSARLESQARPGQVLLSESVYNAVKDRVTAVYLGEIPLKGKSVGVGVYGLSHVNEYTDQTALATASIPPGKDAISYGDAPKSGEKNAASSTAPAAPVV